MNIIKKERQMLEAMSENPLAFYAMLRMRMPHMDNKLKHLPPEELERLEKERQERRAEEARVAKIRNLKCPDCSGRVIRGKKHREFQYRRQYVCHECSTVHYV